MFFYTLAKGDPLKFEEVGKLNFIFALNLKAFEKTYPQIREQYGK